MAIQKILCNKYATISKTDEISEEITSLSDSFKELEKKHTKLEKRFPIFESAFNNNMKNLAKHLETHKAFEIKTKRFYF